MAGKRNEISVPIKGEADFGGAVRDIEQSYDRMERGARETAKDIEADFEKATVEIDVDDRQLRNAERDFEDFTRKLKDGSDVELEVDEAQLRQAFKLAEQLDGLVAELTIDADTAQLNEADRLARALRSFTAKINLDVDGRAELREALGLSEQLDAVRQVRLQVEGRQELERAQQIADDLERRRTVPIDAQASDLVRLDDRIESAITSGGEAGADGVADALGGIDFDGIGRSGLDQLTGALAAAGPWAAVAGTVATIFGDEIVSGFENRLGARRADAVRALSSGLGPEDLALVGEAAGEAYADGFGESLPDLKNRAADLQAAFGSIDEDLDLSAVLRQSEAIETVFGIELPDQIALVRQLVANGLVPDTVSGFNLVAREAQTLGVATEDAFEVLKEFSPVFKKLGIDGATAADIIAKEWDEGLVTQIDRAGEQFEEFNIRMTDGSARESVQALGLDFDELQQKIANGKGQEALAEVAGALAVMPDQAHAAELAVTIFGASVESASDPQRVFELLATADAIGEVGNKGQEMSDVLEDTISPMDRMKRAASDLSSEVAILPGIWAAAFGGDFKTALTEARGLLADLVNPVELFTNAFGGEIDLGPLDKVTDWIRGVEEASGPAVAGAEALTRAVGDGPPKMQEMADASGELAGELDTATQSADELEAELRGMFDFSADRLFRDIADGVADLAEDLKDGGAAAVGMGGSIDISTDAGRRLQEQMEGLNGTMVDAEVAYANNEISAEELARVHGDLESQIRQAGEAAGLTSEEIDGLIGYYLRVPGRVNTDVTANTATAIGNVTALQNAIANIKSKSVTISASISGPTGISASGTISRKARGGPATGLTLVGEEGPELVDFQGQAYVYNANDTKAIIRGAATSGSLAERSTVAQIPAAAGKRVFAEHATFVVDKGVDLWQQADLAEQVYATL